MPTTGSDSQAARSRSSRRGLRKILGRRASRVGVPAQVSWSTSTRITERSWVEGAAATPARASRGRLRGRPSFTIYGGDLGKDFLEGTPHGAEEVAGQIRTPRRAAELAPWPGTKLEGSSQTLRRVCRPLDLERRIQCRGTQAGTGAGADLCWGQVGVRLRTAGLPSGEKRPSLVLLEGRGPRCATRCTLQRARRSWVACDAILVVNSGLPGRRSHRDGTCHCKEARNSPSTSMVNAVWPGIVMDDPRVRSTSPSSRRIRRLPSRTYTSLSRAIGAEAQQVREAHPLRIPRRRRRSPQRWPLRSVPREITRMLQAGG